MSDNKDLSPITESTAAPSPSKSSPGNNGVPATEEETRARLFKGLGKDLLIAIRENDMGKAQGLIMGGVELDARDAYGRTALHLAVQRSAMGVVKLLCKHGIDVNLTDRLTENSAIHIAAHRGQMVMMKHLILAKADTNIVGVEGDTPLSRAATQGHLKVIDTLINEGASADLSTRKKPNEYQLLEQQQQSMAHSWGHSGVMMTAAGSMTSEASFVASPGSRRGRSPTRSGFGAQRAGEYNYMGARERRDPVSPLLKAVKRNAGVPVIKTLLEIGCSPEKTDEKNNTALHVAAHYGNANTCRMLLQAKASVNVLNHLGII
ncbi:unnamed protein product [Amoebophrya sp. A25]|nr:unnamed protein product [Amoebophrya sp. A25]|eukprot:GSA25T00023354001.1